DPSLEIVAVEDATGFGHPGGVLAGLVDEHRMHREGCDPCRGSLGIDELDDPGLVGRQVVGRHHCRRRNEQCGDDDRSEKANARPLQHHCDSIGRSNRLLETKFDRASIRWRRSCCRCYSRSLSCPGSPRSTRPRWQRLGPYSSKTRLSPWPTRRSARCWGGEKSRRRTFLRVPRRSRTSSWSCSKGIPPQSHWARTNGPCSSSGWRGRGGRRRAPLTW